jgi:hypothetical protein
MQAGLKTLPSEIHKLINSVWSKGESSQHLKEFHCYELQAKFYQTLFSKLSPYTDEIIGVISVNFNIIDQNIHLSNTEVKMGVECDVALAVYALQESLCFS